MQLVLMSLPLICAALIMGFSVFFCKSDLYFSFLFLSSSLVATLTFPYVGLSASLVDRLTFMAIAGSLIFFGFLGLLARREVSPENVHSANTPLFLFLMAIILFQFCLNLASIFFARPVNGVGQSVYVPLFLLFAAFFICFFVASPNVKFSKLQTASEYLVLMLFSFLLLNTFFSVMTWNHDLSDSLVFSNDGFRYSPFSNLLDLPGRQSFFVSEPQGFAVFCLASFAIVFTSSSTFRRIVGVALTFVIGSTTQSRLFYIGIIVLTIIVFADKITHSARILRGFVLMSLIAANLFFGLWFASSSTTGLASFSARTYIWRLVVDNWDNESSWFGHSGSLRLEEFSRGIEVRLVFYHAHNLALQYLWDWGFLGLFLLVLMLAALMLLALRMNRGGYILFCTLLLIGLIESSLSFSLMSLTFLPLVLVLKSAAEKSTELVLIGVDSERVHTRIS